MYYPPALTTLYLLLIFPNEGISHLSASFNSCLGTIADFPNPCRSLKDIDGPADWLSGRGKVTRMVLKFVTVERFSEVRRAEELFRSRVWDKWPQSYHTLCAHLDAPEHGSFLTPDHDTFLWQNACHLEIMEAYQGLVNRYASANNL